MPFSLLKILAFLGKGGLLKCNCLGRLQVGGKLSALPGCNALIYTGEAAMSAESVQHCCGAIEALVAYEAQLVVHCSQVIDDGPLILSVFSTAWAVRVTGKALEGLRVMNPL